MINYEVITKQLPGGLAELILELITDVQMNPGKYSGISRDDIMRWLNEEKKGRGQQKV